MFLWDVLLEKCARGPKINAFWILLYNVMTSVLSGMQVLTSHFGFQHLCCNLLAILQDHHQSSQLSPHRLHFIYYHIRFMGVCRKKPFSRNTVYLQDHACKSFPTKSVMSHAQSMETLTLKDGAESKLTFHQSMQFFNILYTYPVNICNPTMYFTNSIQTYFGFMISASKEYKRYWRDFQQV